MSALRKFLDGKGIMKSDPEFENLESFLNFMMANKTFVNKEDVETNLEMEQDEALETINEEWGDSIYQKISDINGFTCAKDHDNCVKSMHALKGYMGYWNSEFLSKVLKPCYVELSNNTNWKKFIFYYCYVLEMLNVLQEEVKDNYDGAEIEELPEIDVSNLDILLN